MKQLRPGLFLMDASAMANSYLLLRDDRVLLIDPGFTWQLSALGRELVTAGLSPYHVTDILLTHYDVDHAQSAAEWARRTGARVWLGGADADVLRTGQAPSTPLRQLLRHWLPELPPGLVELRGEVEIGSGVRAIPTPGHTPGSYAFVVGDAAFIGDTAMTRRNGQLTAMPALLMTDVAQGDRTRAALADMPIRLFCAGHTPPVERALA